MSAHFRTRKISRPQRLDEILRKKRKLSPYQVEEATKIKREYIVALEKRRFSVLPESVYVRGFLRTLARFYQIDPVRLIDGFREEIDPKKPGVQESVNFRTSRLKEPIIIVTPRLLTITLGVIVGLFLIGYLWYEVSGFAVAPKLTLDQPAQEELQIKKDLLRIKGRTESNASLTINQEPIPVNQEGKFNQRIRLQPGFNILTLKATNRSGRETVKKIKIIVSKKYAQIN